MRPQLKPSPQHPIDIKPLGKTVRVTVAGHEVAHSEDALLLQEASYPPVVYIPRKDVRMDLLTRTSHHTYCPYKGEASYFSIPAGGGKSVNAIWTYEEPYEAVAVIREHLAFYPDRVDTLTY